MWLFNRIKKKEEIQASDGTYRSASFKLRLSSPGASSQSDLDKKIHAFNEKVERKYPSINFTIQEVTHFVKKPEKCVLRIKVYQTKNIRQLRKSLIALWNETVRSSHQKRRKDEMKIIKAPLGEYPICPNCGHRWHRRTEEMVKIAREMTGENPLQSVHCPGCDEYYFFK